MKHPDARRGEVWLTRLDPTVGNEIRKTRPCLIISPDSMNAHLGTVIVMPLTSGANPARFRVASLLSDKEGLLLGDQLRSVSKQRLLRMLERINDQTLAAALAILREMFEDD